MQTTVEHEITDAPPPSSDEPLLREIRDELQHQGNEARRLRGNVIFLGGMLTLIALAGWGVMIAKMGTRDIRVTAVGAAPATKKAASPATSATPATPATPGALPSATSVSLKEFKVIPTATTVAAGKVIFKVRNAGTVTHEFVVLKTTHPAAKLPLYKGRADEAGNVGETGDLKPGEAKNIALVLAPGHYALICNLPGHYLAGQRTDFTVK